MGMENPLHGSFNRERTILSFSQRSLEVYASYLAMAGGIVMALVGIGKAFGLFGFLPLMDMWWFFFGLMFALAGLWAYLLFRYLRFDLRKRFYVERVGSSGMVSTRKGSIDEVRCLELFRYQGLLPTQNPQARPSGWGANMPVGQAPPAGTLLGIRLWWHDPYRAPVVIEHLVVGASFGSQDQRAMHFIGLAQAYSQSLRVPLTGSI